MFKFLKDKIGGALSKFSKNVEEESVDGEVVEETEVEVEETEELDKQEEELQKELKKVEEEKKQNEKELEEIEKNKKKEKEEKKKEKERIKKEEEAAAKKLEEENKKLEEIKEKRLEEEKKILDEEKKKLEQQKIEEAELKVKEEEELKKVEEDKRKAEEDEEKKRLAEEAKAKELKKKKREIEEKRRHEQQLKIVEEEKKKREILEEELKKTKEKEISDEKKREEAQIQQIKDEEKLADEEKKDVVIPAVEDVVDTKDKEKILSSEDNYEIERLEQEQEEIKKKEEELKAQTEEIQEKKGFFSKLKSKIAGKKKESVDEEKEESVEEEKEEAVEEKPVEEIKEDVVEEKEEVEVVKKSEGLFAKIKKKVTTKTLSEEKFDDLFWDLEIVLLENNVAVEVIEKIKDDLKKDIVDTPLKKSEIESHILKSLKASIESLFEDSHFDLVKTIHEGKKPFKIVFVGINGSGKTTTIAKFAKFLQKNNFSSVLVAADTFRAAAIQQLEEHGNNLGISVIKQDYGSDPAAVCYDGIQMAQARNLDVVLIDTAGRLHSNVNLMDEMAKIVRVAEPDLILFVGESITGNDCVEQAKNFNKAVELNGIVLSKADIDEKGGAAISVSYVTKKPILFLGTGQEYDDLESFDKYKILESMGL